MKTFIDKKMTLERFRLLPATSIREIRFSGSNAILAVAHSQSISFAPAVRVLLGCLSHV
jgi:hypothetical protein